MAFTDPFEESASLNEILIEEEIADYLKAQGFGNREGESRPIIFVGQAPESGKAIVIFEEGGAPPISGGHTDQPIGERRTISVQTVHADYRKSKAVSQRISRALHLKQGILSSVKVALIQADMQAVYLGKGPDQRHRFSQLFSATTKPIEAP